jgi:hypothetical protein
VIDGGCRSWGVLAPRPLNPAVVLFDSGCVGVCDSARVEPVAMQCVAVGGGCCDCRQGRFDWGRVGGGGGGLTWYCVVRKGLVGGIRGGGSGSGGGGLYSPGTLSSGGGSTASAAACTASYVLVLSSCSPLCLARAVGGGGCLPRVASTCPATHSCFLASLSPTLACVGSSCCSRPLSLDVVGVGICDATRSCSASLCSSAFGAGVTWQSVA